MQFQMDFMSLDICSLDSCKRSLITEASGNIKYIEKQGESTT